MVLSILKRILSPQTPDEQETTREGAAPSPEAFVTYVVKSLVDNPAEVSVTTVEKERTTTIQVACERRDIGKVIGRNGKTIGAIRSLVNGSLGRGDKKVNVEVLD